MASENVIVMCKLPYGLVIEVDEKRMNLRGSRIVAQPNQKNGYVPPEVIYADSLNYINRDLWEAWKLEMGPNYKPLKSGAIYEAANKVEATAKAKDCETQVIGFEGIDPNRKPREVFSRDMNTSGVK